MLLRDPAETATVSLSAYQQSNNLKSRRQQYLQWLFLMQAVANIGIVEQLQQLEEMATDTKLRAHLGRFGFPKAMADTKIAKLSGGEKARLTLALICRKSPHLLLLDEPTNHLDIDSRQALIQALAEYEGAVIIVTHDPYLVDATADRLWLVKNKDCQPFEGDMSEYRNLLERERRAERKAGKGKPAPNPKAAAATGVAPGGPGTQAVAEAPTPDPAPAPTPDATPKGDKRSRAEQRQKIAPLRKAAKDLEAKIEQLGAEKAKIDEKLADPKTYEDGADRINELNRLSADMGQAIQKTEEAWLAAHEALETANRAESQGAS